ncbi:MAG: HEAT repeat domain-containing protein [Acidobacteriota bacterium]
MAQALPLILGFVVATGCGNHRSPSPPSQGEYEQVHGRELSEARRLHAEGKVEESAAILRQLVSDASWEVRARAISVIGELRERSLLPELHRALKDPMPFVRERVTRVLQTVGDVSSLPPLREALSEPDAAVRGNVAEALAKIGGAKELPALTQVLQHDEDEGVRARTASALGEAHLGAAVDPLVSALGDQSVSVRARAVEALGEIGDPRARAALEKSARRDPDSQVRASAAAALKKLRTGTGSESR